MAVASSGTARMLWGVTASPRTAVLSSRPTTSLRGPTRRPMQIRVSSCACARDITAGRNGTRANTTRSCAPSSCPNERSSGTIANGIAGGCIGLTARIGSRPKPHSSRNCECYNSGMPHALAKQLKDAGFVLERAVPGPGRNVHIDSILYRIPTLEELIEACVEQFGNLERYDTPGVGTYWIAYDTKNFQPFSAPTIIEAVARSWLALNKA